MKPAPKKENLLVNLICNVALPALLMAQLSKETRLGPVWGLIVALAFPVSYGIYDFIARKKTNLFSVLGFVGILLSGVLGLLNGRSALVVNTSVTTGKRGILGAVLGRGGLLGGGHGGGCGCGY